MSTIAALTPDPFEQAVAAAGTAVVDFAAPRDGEALGVAPSLVGADDLGTSWRPAA
jgi:hypothetical protein